MLTCLGVAEAFGQSEIDDIHVMLFLANSNQKVIRLNVSVNQALFMHKVYSGAHLNEKVKGSIFTKEFFLANKIE